VPHVCRDLHAEICIRSWEWQVIYQWIKEAGGTAAGYKPLATRIGDKEKPLHKFFWSYQRFMADLVALNGVVPMPRRCCAAWRPLMGCPMSRRSSC
jgi:hypothetical protein